MTEHSSSSTSVIPSGSTRTSEAQEFLKASKTLLAFLWGGTLLVIAIAGGAFASSDTYVVIEQAFNMAAAFLVVFVLATIVMLGSLAVATFQDPNAKAQAHLRTGAAWRLLLGCFLAGGLLALGTATVDLKRPAKEDPTLASVAAYAAAHDFDTVELAIGNMPRFHRGKEEHDAQRSVKVSMMGWERSVNDQRFDTMSASEIAALNVGGSDCTRIEIPGSDSQACASVGGSILVTIE